MEGTGTEGIYLLFWKRGGSETPLWILCWRRCFRCKYFLTNNLQKLSRSLLVHCTFKMLLTVCFCWWDFSFPFQLFEGHFDTTLGAKVEGKSYERIAERIGCQPEEIMFLTDVTRGKFYNYDDQLSMTFKLVHVLKRNHRCTTCDERCWFINPMQRSFLPFP